MGHGSREQLDVLAAAHRYAEGRGTVRELRSALYRDLRGPCDGPLTGGWADMFNAFERWEDTLHVDAAKQAAIEDEIRAIAASSTAGRPLGTARTRRSGTQDLEVTSSPGGQTRESPRMNPDESASEGRPSGGVRKPQFWGRLAIATASLALCVASAGFGWTILAATLGVGLPLAVLLILRWRDQQQHPRSPGIVLDVAAAEIDERGRTMRRGRLSASSSQLMWTPLGATKPESAWELPLIEEWVTHPVWGGLGCVLVLRAHATTLKFAPSATRRSVRKALQALPTPGPEHRRTG